LEVRSCATSQIDDTPLIAQDCVMTDSTVSFVYRIVYAGACRSPHHKIALDALVQTRGRGAERWRNLFLKHYEAYLEGAKAPDTKFKDFRNHVLHVNDDYWGGAIEAAKGWYERTVDLLGRGEWEEGIYSAGVLSHYYTDPIQPFHTAQTAAENRIHRAFEWSVTNVYDELKVLIDAHHGYPEFEVPDAEDWLAEMVKAGAHEGNSYYDFCVEHFDFDAAIKDPTKGLGRELSGVMAELIAYATVGFSRVLEQVFEESGARPPRTVPIVHGVLASLKTPLYWLARNLDDYRDRELVEAMYAELQERGEIVETMPEDDRVVGRMYEREVLKDPRRQQERQREEYIQQNSRRSARRKRQEVPSNTEPVATTRVDSDARVQTDAAEAVSEPKVRTKSRGLAATVASAAAAATAVAFTAPKAGVKRLRGRRSNALTEPNESLADEAQDVEDVAKKPLVEDTYEPRAELNKIRLSTGDDSNIDTDDPAHDPFADPFAEDTDELASDKSPSTTRTSFTPDYSSPISKTPNDTSGHRFYLQRSDMIESAPSIGKKTAKRLAKANVYTVDDFLSVDADDIAERLGVRYMDGVTLRDWQHQAELVCRIPNLRGHDAQILVACGLTSPLQISAVDSEELLLYATEFCDSDEGLRVLRGGNPPDANEVSNWIRWAAEARSLKAAA